MTDPAAAEVQAPRGEELTAAEVLTAIRSLSPAEKTALTKIARFYSKWTRAMYEHQDLIHEAYIRILDGRRRWPRGMAATLFFHGVIKSVAWEWLNEKKMESNEIVDASDEGVTERGVLAKIEVIKVIKLFDDDHVAQQIVIGMMDGIKGDELQQSSGLNQTEYESKRKKIRRRIEREFM
jgi:hypothetical protein